MTDETPPCDDGGLIGGLGFVILGDPSEQARVTLKQLTMEAALRGRRIVVLDPKHPSKEDQ